MNSRSPDADRWLVGKLQENGIAAESADPNADWGAYAEQANMVHQSARHITARISEALKKAQQTGARPLTLQKLRSRLEIAEAERAAHSQRAGKANHIVKLQKEYFVMRDDERRAENEADDLIASVS